MAGPIAEAYVELRFDESQLESGARGAFSKVERLGDAAAEDVESAFREASNVIESEMTEAARGTEQAFDSIDIGDGIADQFDGAGADSASSFLGSLGPGLLAAGGVAAIGVAAAGALSAGFSEALGQEDVTAGLEASLGLTEQEAEEAGRVAAELYRDAWGDSLADVGDAVEAVIGNFPDISGPALEDVSEQALAFAEVFEIDVAEAAAAAGIAVENDLAGSATEAFDLLTKSFQEVPPLIRDEITAAVSEYGKSFDQLGIAGPEAFGLLVDASDQGIIGIDKAGDAIKEFTIRASDGSTASKEALEALGLSSEETFSAIAGGGEPAAEAFDQIVDGLLGIEDPAEQANTAIALFGTPLEDLGTENIPDFLSALSGGETALQDFAGSADAAGETLSGTTSAKIESFKREALGTLADFIGNVVIPGIEGFSQVLSSTIGPAIDAVRSAVQALVEWWEQNWPRIQETIQPLIDFVVNVLWPGLQAVWGFIQEEVGALLLWWEENWPLFQETIQGVWEAIVVIIEAAWAYISTVIEVALAFITVLWNTFGETIVNYITTTWDNIKQIIDAALTIIRGIIDTVTALIRGDWQAVWDGIRTILSGVWDLMVGIVRQAMNILETAIRIPLDLISALWSGAWEGIKSFLSGIWDEMTGLVSGAIDEVVGFFSGLPERVGTAFSTLGEAILAPFRWAFDQIKSLWNNTVGGFGFSIPSWVPGVGGKSFTIPEMALGGIVTGPTLAMIGEAGPEIVIPLTRPSRAAQLLEQSGLVQTVEGAGGPAVQIERAYFTEPTDADLMAQKVVAATAARSAA